MNSVKQKQNKTISLKPGLHEFLKPGTYNVFGLKLKLKGRIFIAHKYANWIPIKKCSCNRKRKRKPLFIHQNGKTAIILYCDNKDCSFFGHYIYTIT